MSVSRLVVVALFALGLGALLTACQRAGDADVARTEDGVMKLGTVEVVDTVARTVAPSGRPLVLKGMRGPVHLTGAERSTASFRFVRRGRGDSRKAAQSALQDISITERGTESAYTFTLEAAKRAHAAVAIQGQVPRSTTLRVDRLSGAVHVTGVHGALTIQHQHGDVRVQGAAAPVEVTIQNGDLQVGFESVPAEGPMLLQTSNGDVRVRLPTSAEAQIDAQTDVGVIRTRGLSFATEQFAPVNAGARYTAQLGKGGPTVEIRTENGSITLQARETTPPDTLAEEQGSAPAFPDTTGLAPADPDTQRTDTLPPDTTAADTLR